MAKLKNGIYTEPKPTKTHRERVYRAKVALRTANEKIINIAELGDRYDR